MSDDNALIEAIRLLGFDPEEIGPLCYEILSTDLKRRFEEQGTEQTLEQIRRFRSR